MPNNALIISENHDIEYSGFRLHKNGLSAIGVPTYEQWEECGAFIKKAGGSVHAWLGDWLNYGESHYGETYTQALEATDYEEGTLRNDKWIYSKVQLSERSDNLGVQHAQIIAPLPDEERKYWAEEIRKEAIPVRDLKKKIQERKFKQLPSPVVPKDKYNVIVIDPPWPYGTVYDPETRRVANPYPEMSLEDISALEIPAAEDCVMWLWTTHKFMFDAKQILEKWGFEYKACLVWDKEIIGMGAWLRMQCEFCLLGIKGKPRWDLSNQRDIIHSKRREHSRKPDEIYLLAQELSPNSKCIDIFSRQERAGWDQYGNETAKF